MMDPIYAGGRRRLMSIERRADDVDARAVEPTPAQRALAAAGLALIGEYSAAMKRLVPTITVRWFSSGGLPFFEGLAKMNGEELEIFSVKSDWKGAVFPEAPRTVWLNVHAPRGLDGLATLAHELRHVQQFLKGGPAVEADDYDAWAACELDAERFATMVMAWVETLEPLEEEGVA
jgi:hypothetical protein